MDVLRNSLRSMYTQRSCGRSGAFLVKHKVVVAIYVIIASIASNYRIRENNKNLINSQKEKKKNYFSYYVVFFKQLKNRHREQL